MGGAGKAQRVELRYWEFLGGEVLTNPDNEALTLPEGCIIVEIDSEDDVCYYAINQGGAAAGSHGFVPSNGGRILGPIANLNTMHVHAPTATVHVMYFREH